MQLYAHQREALDKMRGKKAFALLMGMRTGKTRVLIEDWLQSGSRDLLVIAPAGVYRTWESELAKWACSQGVSYEVQAWVSGSEWHISRVYNMIENVPHFRRVLLMNVEALSTIEAAQKACAHFFLSRAGATMAIDESTTIKNTRSKRTQAIQILGKVAARRRILSGLPTPQSPLDLYGQFEFLDHKILGFVSQKAFEDRYAIKRKLRVGGGRRYVDIVVGYKNVDELWGKIEPYSYRRLLKDCADVPDKMYITREVELTPEQRRLYDDLKGSTTAQLTSGDWVTASEVVTLLLRLHQLCCGHLVDESGAIHNVPSNRLQALLDLLADFDGKAIIWCSYRHDVGQIATALPKGNVAVFTGENRDTREAESERFKGDPNCRFMVATPGAGGRGRTWPEADLLIYWSISDNLEFRDQSEERASGIEKARRITIVDLITRGTVEEKIIKALREKIDLAATVTNDNWREWVI